MCAAHLGRGQVSSTGAAERLPSPSFCELVDQYTRLDERREFPRLPLSLTVNIRRVGGRLQPEPIRVSTANISCGGLLLILDRALEPGTTLDLEVVMADHPLGGPSLRMFSRAHVVRQSPAGRLGWTGVAAVFDDISFDRDPAY
jgi:c-di-GMP-binding flagellar brake protein YcgR